MSRKNKEQIRLMEVCGTHTMAIARSGIKKALPKNIELISGPGCPVCVTPQKGIDKAIKIASIKNVIMTTFGDMMRVPGTNNSLHSLKGEGKDVRVIYSCLDALNIAKDNPDKKVVFMGVGFETTSPTVAAAVLEAERERLKNFSVLSNFKAIFPALEAIAGSRHLKIDGFICPGHVSVITGSNPYKKIAKYYKKPCVIAGFEPDDILKGIRRLIMKLRKDEYDVEIEYERAVQTEGNPTALRVLDTVFRPVDSIWRGLGLIQKSGLKLRKRYKVFDAEEKFKVKVPESYPLKGCICAKILTGEKLPADCKLFKKVCSPESPIGPCMVSSEGTCAAYYRYEG